MTQAHTLDAIFNRLMNIGIHSDTLPKPDTYLKLGLRAQSQSRARWETLVVIKNPIGRAYVGQANFANNQQINNETASRTREKEKSPNELDEETHREKRLVRGASRGAVEADVGADSHLEAVGEIDRSEVV